VELQDILQEIKKLHNADPLPEGHLATPVESVANSIEAQTVAARTPRKDSTAPQWKKPVTAHSDCTLDTPREHDEPALEEAHVAERSRPQGVDITFDSDPDSDIDELRREWRAKYATESHVFSCESDSTCSDCSCGREGSTPNRMAPVQMRISRVQPKAVDCVATQQPTVT
jgi:hypothetical protein